MRRLQKQLIAKDLRKKLVFIVGPRQVGKTWLANDIAAGRRDTVYLNYDRLEDRKIIQKEAWLDSTKLLILDEIHKMRGWKNHLKGVFDAKPRSMQILVTGSARLDAFRQTGDSLAGRFFVHHLLPFSLAELRGTELEGQIDLLMERGGFPEPLLAEDAVDSDRWRFQYADGLIRTDVLDFERVHDFRAIQTIFDLLRSSVGSLVSYASLARDAGVAPNTAKKYVEVLEALYIVFRVTPHSRNVGRSLLKAPKIYFFDTGLVKGDSSLRLENLVALDLYKHVLGRTDREGRVHELKYLRRKEGREVDFCLVREERPYALVEVKYSDAHLTKALVQFSDELDVDGFQLVHQLKRERRSGRLSLRKAGKFLTDIDSVLG